MALLYNPEKGKHEYDLPIFDNDNAIGEYTWRYLMDTYVANYGHNPDPQKFREHIMEFMQMLTDDVMETFDLCEEKIMEGISNA